LAYGFEQKNLKFLSAMRRAYRKLDFNRSLPIRAHNQFETKKQRRGEGQQHQTKSGRRTVPNM
jgi:hypothetical protein